mmetsp:Transcript_36246/g.68243  ORF Transcript_36246/g.68243 Transcript_36246/m.68243 type:complete len:205 (+) Transcript_36246:105-719(+)
MSLRRCAPTCACRTRRLPTSRAPPLSSAGARTKSLSRTVSRAWTRGWPRKRHPPQKPSPPRAPSPPKATAKAAARRNSRRSTPESSGSLPAATARPRWCRCKQRGWRLPRTSWMPYQRASASWATWWCATRAWQRTLTWTRWLRSWLRSSAAWRRESWTTHWAGTARTWVPLGRRRLTGRPSSTLWAGPPLAHRRPSARGATPR